MTPEKPARLVGIPDLCSFDAMPSESGPSRPAPERLAALVCGADTARPDVAPWPSRMPADDLERLEAGMPLCAAPCRWARDAYDRTHEWPATKTGSR